MGARVRVAHTYIHTYIHTPYTHTLPSPMQNKGGYFGYSLYDDCIY